MTHTFESSAAPAFPSLGFFPVSNAKDLFKQRFRCSIAQCIRRGFQVEECFGLIWEETLEEVELSFRDQNELYPELIEWARRWIQ
jgi:hypothetical protein